MSQTEEDLDKLVDEVKHSLASYNLDDLERLFDEHFKHSISNKLRWQVRTYNNEGEKKFLWCGGIIKDSTTASGYGWKHYGYSPSWAKAVESLLTIVEMETHGNSE